VLAALAAACSKEPPTPSAAPAPKPAAVVLGEPISAAPVALSEVAKNPRAFEGRALSTSGTVTAMCKSQGCWMEITDATSQAHVRMHGHSFFIPKSANGHHARVQATIVPSDDATECEESKAQSGNQSGNQGGSRGGIARVELDATGVELD